MMFQEPSLYISLISQIFVSNFAIGLYFSGNIFNEIAYTDTPYIDVTPQKIREYLYTTTPKKQSVMN